MSAFPPNVLFLFVWGLSLLICIYFTYICNRKTTSEAVPHTSPQRGIVEQLGPNATQITTYPFPNPYPNSYSYPNPNPVRPQTLDTNPTQTSTRAFTSPMPSAPNLSEEDLMANDGLPTYESVVCHQVFFGQIRR